MKLRNITALIAVLGLIFTASCSSKKEPRINPKLTGDLSNLPSWVLDPEVENGVAAVGIASPSRGGIKFQIPKAEMDAKANIAAIIRTEVSRVTKNSLREANVNDVNDVEEFFSQATKEVVKDIPLSGVKRINIYKGEDGTLYVHMLLKKEDYSDYLAESRDSFEKKLKKANIARENIAGAEKAAEKMFDELEKERNR